MKKTWIPLLVLVLLLVIACGGGGGGGGSSSGGNAGPPRVEAVLASNPDQPIDPLNIQVGDTVQFQVVSYTNAGVRQVTAGTTWTTTDNGNQAGILSSDGVLTATASTSGTKYTVTANGNSSLTGQYQVKNIQAILTGSVVDTNGLPVSGAILTFYNSSLVEVAEVKTAYNGYFRASVPNTARVANFKAFSLPKAKYFRSFSYAGKRYTVLETTCSVAIPTPVNGTTSSLGVFTVDAAFTGNIANPPPPPPDGCS